VDRQKDVVMHMRMQHSILTIRIRPNCKIYIITYSIATKLYASGKAGAGGDGFANRDFGMVMRLGGRAGRGVGALTGGVVDGTVHQGAGMSSARSGLVRRVLANSEVGSCTARVKRERSSGVSAAHISSAEALSTNF
jgi:hypothetical protein